MLGTYVQRRFVHRVIEVDEFMGPFSREQILVALLEKGELKAEEWSVLAEILESTPPDQLSTMLELHDVQSNFGLMQTHECGRVENVLPYERRTYRDRSEQADEMAEAFENIVGRGRAAPVTRYR